MCEELLVCSVHLGKVVHGGEENADFDNLGNVGASFLQHGGEVLDAKLGHLGYGGAGKSENSSCWVAGDLAGAVDCCRGCDCLGLGIGQFWIISYVEVEFV